jgi:hypothetical protein
MTAPNPIRIEVQEMRQPSSRDNAATSSNFINTMLSELEQKSDSADSDSLSLSSMALMSHLLYAIHF